MLKLRKKITRWILLILWMGFIFYMSSKSGTESSHHSNMVLKLIQLTGIDQNGAISQTLTFIIRKLGHFTEYMILFVLIYRVVNLYITSKWVLIASIIVLFLYACSDELHQFFSPGREPAFRDVIIDTCGGSVSLLCIYIRSLKLKRLQGNKVVRLEKL